ncbi:NIF3-like protein 1 [Parasteatoda tepidariorum]|uniref:NIF3-like protein 1 n=1 Tax=Parasteatoda tepidariorum TaxID=114398 RepID=UPI001C72633F|nr:NIF3-like protein 1 [Parasteatoda tepidariorum]
MRKLLNLKLLKVLNQRYFSLFPKSISNKSFLSKQTALLSLSNIVYGKNVEYYRSIMDIKSVIKIIESNLPPELAEKWDKTGLLIKPDDNIEVSSIFFTIDLTEKVLDEAVSQRANMIIAYHPPIFSPLPKLVSDNWKDRIVMKCIKNSIAVYSPHTVCDIVDGGVNDWLLKCFDVCDICAVQTKQDFSDSKTIFEFTLPNNINIDNFMKNFLGFDLISVYKHKETQFVRLSSDLPHWRAFKMLSCQDEVEFISVKSASRINSIKGVGRVAKLKHSLKLKDCIDLVKNYLNLAHVRFSLGVKHSLDTEIETIAVCAGSGASVLKDVTADLYFTGEMSHHEVLHAIHNNTSIILVEHSNSERGYLKNLADLLQPQLRNIKLNISSVDRDPICIV